MLGGRAPVILGHMVTTRCNLRCSFCTYWREEGVGSDGEMDLSAIRSLLFDAAESGVAVYTMTGGEPLLRVDAPDILASARKRGLFSMLITNGSLLHRFIAALPDATDLTVVSLDSLDPVVYRKLRGKGADLSRVVGNIDLLAEAVKGKGEGRWALNCVITDDNVGEVRAIAGFARERGGGVTFEPVLGQPLDDCPGLTASYRELGEMLLRLKDEQGNVLNSRAYLEALRDGRRPKCLSDMVLRVGPRGDVTGPCLDHPSSAVVGNVTRKPLKEILASKEWREAHAHAKDCTRPDCWMSCYTEPALLLKKPVGTLVDALVGLVR
jgi:MoaA/NifB/PqqE/SkfB family radical SAM enzyme